MFSELDLDVSQYVSSKRWFDLSMFNCMSYLLVEHIETILSIQVVMFLS